MVSLMLWLILGVAGPVPPSDTPTDRVARAALERGRYPWYDAKADAANPIWPPQEPSFSWLDRWFGSLRRLGRLQLGSLHLGELLIIGIVILALSVLLVVLIELWRRHRPTPGDSEAAVPSLAKGARIEGLPTGVRPETDDPWAEAVQWRERGDYASAVVCLFAHQLIALHRLRVLRLRPGRTGRQLVRAVDDPRFRTPLDATLRLFETVYYGHLAPSAEAFEAVWSKAEVFERHVAEGSIT